MSLAAVTLRRARRRAGMTQEQLATRLGTTQSAVARLERPGSDPRLSTLADALSATGHRLDLRPVRRPAGVDDQQLRERLRLTPHERLQAFIASQRRLDALRARARGA